jgi:hypothetical protein
MRTGICSCGADIEEVIDTLPAAGKFWQRVGTCEVCVDNHWHEPRVPVEKYFDNPAKAPEPKCGVVWEKMAELGHYVCAEPKGHKGHHDDHKGSRWYTDHLPAAQPVSAPSPVTDGLQWQMWKGDNGLDYVDMRDYRTAREDRDRIEENCRILHGDNEGLIAHYRDQLIREREARKQEAVEQFNAGLEAAAMDSCSRCRSGIPLVEFDGHMYHEYHKGRDYRDCYSLGIRKLLKSVSGSPERLEGGK